METVYRLRESGVYLYRYVGVTNDVYQRFAQHLRCESANEELNTWIGDLRQKGSMVLLEPIEHLPDRDEAERQETFWIRSYLLQGHPLLNRAKLGRHPLHEHVATMHAPANIEVYVPAKHYETVYAHYAEHSYKIRRQTGEILLQLTSEHYHVEKNLFILQLTVGSEGIWNWLLTDMQSALSWGLLQGVFSTHACRPLPNCRLQGKRLPADRPWRQDLLSLFEVENYIPPPWEAIQSRVSFV